MNAQVAKSNHILVIDDSSDLLVLIQLALQNEGFRVTPVENGKDALAFLETRADLPGLILLDLMMPVMDGYQFRREQLKMGPDIAQIPVVVMTANYDLTSLKHLNVIDGYIRKPMELDDLISVVQTRLKDHSASI